MVGAIALAGPDGERFPVSIADVESKAAERFASLDVDKSGAIDLAEFEAAKHKQRGERSPRHDAPRHPKVRKHMGSHGQRQAMRAAIEEEMFTIIDSNGDGMISKTEHQNSKPRETRALARKRAMFKQLDQDQDQLLTLSEMPNPAERLRRVDADDDGLVTKAEMRAARTQRQARPEAEAG
jgi:Ca2+-binding EF-hand superfamily protein